MNKFKIDYEVNSNDITIINTIEKAIKKMERIITKSNNNNYKYNGKIIKDIYIIFTVSDKNIPEDNGPPSKDTIAGTKIKTIKVNNKKSYPVLSHIQLNTESIDYYTVLHEIFHALGVGLWEDKSLIQNNKYVGSAVTYHNNGKSVKLNDDKVHFDIENDILSAYATDKTVISDIAIGSLEDLGYEVNYMESDTYPFNLFMTIFIIFILFTVIAF